MPKDTKQTMLAQYERRGKASPAPGHSHQPLSWKGLGGDFSAATKFVPETSPDRRNRGAGPGAKDEKVSKPRFQRLTFCDEAANRSRKVPSPGRYRPDPPGDPPLGKVE